MVTSTLTVPMILLNHSNALCQMEFDVFILSLFCQPRPELGVKRGMKFPEKWKNYWFDYDPVTKVSLD